MRMSSGLGEVLVGDGRTGDGVGDRCGEELDRARKCRTMRDCSYPRLVDCGVWGVVQ